MAELILSEEEKEAATWLELPDDAVGKLVKYTALGIVEFEKEDDRAWYMSACMLMIGRVAERGARAAKFDILGYSHEGQEFGSWRVTIERIEGDE